MPRNTIIVYLDDYETTLDLVIRASYDQADRVMDDIRVYVRADAGEVLATHIFSEDKMDKFTEMLFDELYNGYEE